jgi:hypothetical protein
MTSWVAGQPRDAGVIRPSVVIFDVVGTLASLDPVRVRLESIGQPAHMFEGWFARLLCDGMALTLAGGYRPFGEVAASALAAHTRGALTGNGACSPTPHPARQIAVCESSASALPSDAREPTRRGDEHGRSHLLRTRQHRSETPHRSPHPHMNRDPRSRLRMRRGDNGGAG